MKVFYSSKDFPKKINRTVVALGNFDGVHLAHRAMFQITRRLAKKLKGKSVAYTFEPHPAKVLSKASQTLRINTLEQKLELLKEQKLDAVVVEPFDKRFSALGPEEWFQQILMARLHAKGVVAGYDFTFGNKRSGTSELLHQLCERKGIHCEILSAQLNQGTLISSSQIRQFVSMGRVDLAAQLLGRPFFIDGEVIQGFGRGAAIGIPTANLKVLGELLPSQGVYACRAKLGRRTYRAVTNIGMNPTFGGESLSVETHLLGFSKNIYGKKIRLFFMEKIREEKAFASADALVAQIHEDMDRAKKLLKRNSFISLK